MDAFEAWLDQNRDSVALRDSSYRKVLQKERRYADGSGEVNTELATLGDGVLRMFLCELLWQESRERLSERKQGYESDRVLVSVIAKHYGMLDRMHFDREDEHLPVDYVYCGDKHKYIATAVEACLGLIWLHTQDPVVLREIVKGWMALIDGEGMVPSSQIP